MSESDDTLASSRGMVSFRDLLASWWSISLGTTIRPTTPSTRGFEVRSHLSGLAPLASVRIADTPVSKAALVLAQAQEAAEADGNPIGIAVLRRRKMTMGDSYAILSARDLVMLLSHAVVPADDADSLAAREA